MVTLYSLRTHTCNGLTALYIQHSVCGTVSVFIMEEADLLPKVDKAPSFDSPRLRKEANALLIRMLKSDTHDYSALQSGRLIVSRSKVEAMYRLNCNPPIMPYNWMLQEMGAQNPICCHRVVYPFSAPLGLDCLFMK
jgi:hypothetical protein